jgi:hypothetical protein
MLRIPVPSNNQRRLKKLQVIKELAKILRKKEIIQLPARAVVTIKPHPAIKEINSNKVSQELRGMTKMGSNNKPKQTPVAYQQAGEIYWDVGRSPSWS